MRVIDWCFNGRGGGGEWGGGGGGGCPKDGGN